MIGGQYRFSKSREHSMASPFYYSPSLLNYYEENVAGLLHTASGRTMLLGLSTC